MGPDQPNNQPPVPTEPQPVEPPATPQPSQPVPQQPAPQQPLQQFDGQPVPAPMQAQPGMQPVQPAGMPQPAQSHSPKLSKKLIAIIAGAAVLLLALVIILAVVFAGPSKADYQKATDLTNSAQDAWGKISGVYVSTSSTKTELANSVDTMKSAKSDLFKQLDDLSKNRAITADKDLKEKWKAVTDKKAKLDGALAARIEAYEKIYPIVIDVNDSPSTPSEAMTMLKDAQTKISAISGLQNQNNKKYVERLKKDLDKLIPVLEKVIAMRQNPATYDSSVMNQYYDLTGDLSDADRDWSSTMNKEISDSEIDKELSELSTKINEQYYKRK